MHFHNLSEDTGTLEHNRQEVGRRWIKIASHADNQDVLQKTHQLPPEHDRTVSPQLVYEMKTLIFLIFLFVLF